MLALRLLDRVATWWQGFSRSASFLRPSSRAAASTAASLSSACTRTCIPDDFHRIHLVGVRSIAPAPRMGAPVGRRPNASRLEGCMTGLLLLGIGYGLMEVSLINLKPHQPAGPKPSVGASQTNAVDPSNACMLNRSIQSKHTQHPKGVGALAFSAKAKHPSRCCRPTTHESQTREGPSSVPNAAAPSLYRWPPSTPGLGWTYLHDYGTFYGRRGSKGGGALATISGSWG